MGWTVSMKLYSVAIIIRLNLKKPSSQLQSYILHKISKSSDSNTGSEVPCPIGTCDIVEVSRICPSFQSDSEIKPRWRNLVQCDIQVCLS